MKVKVCYRTVMKKIPINTIFVLGFVIYIYLLVRIILFKNCSPFELFSPDRVLHRGLCLIPFRDVIRAYCKLGYLNSQDIWGNIVLFIPLGIYLRPFFRNINIYRQLGIIIGTSLIFETIQYAFAIGGCDMTDVTTNTVGGIIGLAIFAAIRKLSKDDSKAKIFIIIFSTLAIILITLMRPWLLFF